VDFRPVLIVAAIAAFVALVVVAAVVSVRRDRRRRKALRQWAARYGWAYVERPATDWPARLPGHNRRGVSLVVSGVVDRYPVSVADYSYTQTSTSTTGSSSSSMSSTTTTYHFVVVVVRLARPGPTVAVQPRHGLSKLGRAIFGDSATALGYEPFDRAFRVVSKEPAAARQLIGPVLAGEHVAGRVPQWSLRGAELLTYRQGRLGDPAGIPDLARPLVRVATLLGR